MLLQTVPQPRRQRVARTAGGLVTSLRAVEENHFVKHGLLGQIIYFSSAQVMEIDSITKARDWQGRINDSQ